MSGTSGPDDARRPDVPPFELAANAQPGSGGTAHVLTRTVKICNKRGLHARAAAKFVTLAEQFGASVDVVKDGQVVSARSIMGLMMLGAGIGSPIELRAEGWDAREALEALTALVEAGFHEQG
jgi:phosphocarrier protein